MAVTANSPYSPMLFIFAAPALTKMQSEQPTNDEPNQISQFCRIKQFNTAM
jgi:hypothetical protein